MNLILRLSSDIEAKLREQAAITGQSPEELALQALEEQLAASTQLPAGISADEWVADIRSWAESHRHLPREADDRRESIYAGRGE